MKPYNIDTCDSCGAPLGPGEWLAGLCGPCWAALESTGGGAGRRTVPLQLCGWSVLNPPGPPVRPSESGRK